jgi:hypothetical protein
VRLVDATVRGTASLSGARLATPDGYALLADRWHVGGELYLRRLRCEGTLRMQNLEVGATLDCTGAALTRPRLRPDGTLRPSLDLRAAAIGKDLVCVEGFTAAGGVRARVADVHKSVQFVDATLGTSGRTRYALNLYGLTTIDLLLLPAAPPAGAVRLARRGSGRSPTRRICGRPRAGSRSTGSTTRRSTTPGSLTPGGGCTCSNRRRATTPRGPTSSSPPPTAAPGTRTWPSACS